VGVSFLVCGLVTNAAHAVLDAHTWALLLSGAIGGCAGGLTIGVAWPNRSWVFALAGPACTWALLLGSPAPVSAWLRTMPLAWAEAALGLTGAGLAWLSVRYVRSRRATHRAD